MKKFFIGLVLVCSQFSAFADFDDVGEMTERWGDPNDEPAVRFETCVEIAIEDGHHLSSAMVIKK